MSVTSSLKSLLLMVAPVAIVITALAWKGNAPANNDYHFNNKDTVPSGKQHPEHKSPEKTWEKDLDREMNSLEDAIDESNDRFDDADWSGVGEQLENALRDIEQELRELQLDPDAIQQQIDESLKSVDMEKINREIERAVQQAGENIDIKEIQEEIRRSIDDAMEEIRNEASCGNMEENDEADMQDTEEEQENEPGEIINI